MAESTRSQPNKELVLKLIEDFPKKRVLVIGDSILDTNTYLELIGKSLEHPVPKYKHLRTEHSFGGAANVVKNILALGGQCTFVTLLGDDSASKNFYEWNHPSLKFCPVVERGRQTTIKDMHWVVQGNETIPHEKIDYLDNREISAVPRAQVLEKIAENADADITLLVDYRHGMMSPLLTESAREFLKGRRIIASSQISQANGNHREYAGIGLICMNQKEAESLLATAGSSSTAYLDLEGQLGSVCVTLGKNGSILYSQGKTYPAGGIKVKEVDSCGAGDSFLAALSLTDFREHPLETLYIANVWAGLSVTKRGTQAPEKQEFVNYIKEN